MVKCIFIASRNNKTLCFTGAGPDPQKPKAKKAKALRLERKRQKLAEKGMDSEVVKGTKEQEKSIEDWLSIPEASDPPTHQFSVRLVRVGEGDPVYRETFAESHALYQKYQVE